MSTQDWLTVGALAVGLLAIALNAGKRERFEGGVNEALKDLGNNLARLAGDQKATEVTVRKLENTSERRLDNVDLVRVARLALAIVQNVQPDIVEQVIERYGNPMDWKPAFPSHHPRFYAAASVELPAPAPTTEEAAKEPNL